VSVASLLDVNVLVASVYEWHSSHKQAHAWWRQSSGRPWASCSLTEAGFVRIISSRSFHQNPVAVGEAIQLLAELTQRPGHRFWPMDINLQDTVQPFEKRLVGHQQVTDAYLLGLAVQNRGQLVTLDRGIEALAGSEFGKHLLVLD